MPALYAPGNPPLGWTDSFFTRRLGLFVGKPVGVLVASWIAVRTGITTLPSGGTWRQIVGVSFLCGIGFTMSLFVANLAFPGDASQLAATKVGILVASIASGIAGGILVAQRGKGSGTTDHTGVDAFQKRTNPGITGV